MLVVTAVVVAAAAAILLAIASIGGFDPSKEVISDPAEGTVTQAVENPATPEHPAFPSPYVNNFSSPTEVNGDNNNNNSFTEQTLVKALSTAIIFWY